MNELRCAPSIWIRPRGQGGVLFAISTVVAGGVIFPSLPKSGSSVLFWCDIAQHTDFESYQREFQRVLRRKYSWLRVAIMLFGCAVFSVFGEYLRA